MSENGFDLHSTFVHLGLGSTATPLPDFSWSPEYLDSYSTRFERDGDEGRLVCIMAQEATWDSWERHPAGEEVVFVVSGRIDLVQEIDGQEHVIALGPGEFAVNPPNVWHTARVHQPGEALFITPGRGTEGRPG